MKNIDLRNKTIFVTGGIGFIGANLILKLLREDAPFFRLRLEYRGETLVRAVLNGKEIVQEACG